jgi:hypothetical protein
MGFFADKNFCSHPLNELLNLKTAVDNLGPLRIPWEIKLLALLPNLWVIRGCFSDGLEHTGQNFQAEILLIA